MATAGGGRGSFISVNTHTHTQGRGKSGRMRQRTFDGVEVRTRDVAHHSLLLVGGANVNLQGATNMTPC